MNIWREERSLIEREGYLCEFFREFERNVGHSSIALASPELLVRQDLVQRISGGETHLVLLVKVEQQVLVERATQERAKQSSTVDTTICNQPVKTIGITMEIKEPRSLTSTLCNNFQIWFC